MNIPQPKELTHHDIGRTLLIECLELEAVSLSTTLDNYISESNWQEEYA